MLTAALSVPQEVFGYRIELNLIQYIMAILDYVSADILKVLCHWGGGGGGGGGTISLASL